MNSQWSTKQTKARPNKNTAETAENISAVKRNQNKQNDVPAISSQVVLRKLLGMSSHRSNNMNWVPYPNIIMFLFSYMSLYRR